LTVRIPAKTDKTYSITKHFTLFYNPTATHILHQLAFQVKETVHASNLAN